MVERFRLDSPVGPLELAADGTALTGVWLRPGDGQTRPASDAADRLVREAARQLDAYFARRLTVFDLPLAPEGTPFQREVWAALRAIRYGETTSYGELARAIGRPAAIRAVGAANGRNPIPIIIPCHRVIGRDGSLVGFGGGLEMKRALLALESGALF